MKHRLFGNNSLQFALLHLSFGFCGRARVYCCCRCRFCVQAACVEFALFFRPSRIYRTNTNSFHLNAGMRGREKGTCKNDNMVLLWSPSLACLRKASSLGSQCCAKCQWQCTPINAQWRKLRKTPHEMWCVKECAMKKELADVLVSRIDVGHVRLVSPFIRIIQLFLEHFPFFVNNNK